MHRLHGSCFGPLYNLGSGALLSGNHKQSNDFPHFRCWCESMHRLQRPEPRCSRMQNSPTIFLISWMQKSRLQHQNAHAIIDAPCAGIMLRRLWFIHPVQWFRSQESPTDPQDLPRRPPKRPQEPPRRLLLWIFLLLLLLLLLLTTFGEAQVGLGGLKLDEIEAANSFPMLPIPRNGLKWPVMSPFWAYISHMFLRNCSVSFHIS